MSIRYVLLDGRHLERGTILAQREFKKDAGPAGGDMFDGEGHENNPAKMANAGAASGYVIVRIKGH